MTSTASISSIPSNQSDVITLQQQLRTLGFYAGKIDGDFGPLTTNACILYTCRSLGVAKAAAAIPAPATLSPFQEKFLMTARSQVGTMETGQNRGAVEKYLNALGLAPGNPYCLAGLFWCARETATSLGTTNPLPRTGLCAEFWRIVKAGHPKLQIVTGPVQPADIGVIVRSNGTGHVFAINHLISADTWKTIEFNSNSKGDREGEGVVTLERHRNTIKDFKGIVRIIA